MDNHWIEAETRREAYLMDLMPRGRFEVIARNHHRVWQEGPSAVALPLEPGFYQAAWFYVSCGFALAALTTHPRWRR